MIGAIPLRWRVTSTHTTQSRLNSRQSRSDVWSLRIRLYAVPISSDFGTYKTVRARFWPSRPGESPRTLLGRSLLARKRRLRGLKFWLQGFECRESLARTHRGLGNCCGFRARVDDIPASEICNPVAFDKPYRGTSLMMNCPPP